MEGKQPDSDSANRWGFFAAIKELLSAFPQATTGQKAAVVAMGLLCAMFIGLGLIGSVALPAWAVVSIFGVATLLIFMIAAMLLFIERTVSTTSRCRHVPIFPPDSTVRTALRDALNEIRRDAVSRISKEIAGVNDEDIRANIFLLARIQGGKFDGKWKLVIHDDFAMNMNLPVERQLQFAVGQGSTGIAYRDGTYQLTRRQQFPKGQWDVKFQMTPELEAQVESRLKWIVSFPLLRPGTTSEAVGVLNIDGLTEVTNDDILNKLATSVRDKVNEVAKTLSLQPSTCVEFDQLGVMDHV
jgi:hypothetical protein